MGSVATIMVSGLGPVRCQVEADALTVGRDCVVALEHGQHVGRVTALNSAAETGECRRSRAARFVRLALPADLDQERSNQNQAAELLAQVTERVRREHLAVRPLRSHCSLDRQHITLFYSADEAINERALAAALQQELGVPVELCAVGLRDQAGILGGFGSCGRGFCCATWLSRFTAVNIRMAREQDLSLNPDAISGPCGRLKCCLRFEHEAYREAAARLPPEGARVVWDEHAGAVVGRSLLSGRLTVRLDDRRVVRVASNRVTIVEAGGAPGEAPGPTATDKEISDANSSGQRAEPPAAGNA